MSSAKVMHLGNSSKVNSGFKSVPSKVNSGFKCPIFSASGEGESSAVLLWSPSRLHILVEKHNGRWQLSTCSHLLSFQWNGWKLFAGD